MSRHNKPVRDQQGQAAVAAGPQTVDIDPIGIHANLLPEEFYRARREAKAVNYAVIGLILLVVLGVFASFVTHIYANKAATQLGLEQQRTVLIQNETKKYAEVTTINNELDLAGKAQDIALFAETDWETVMTQFLAGLPANSEFTQLAFSEPAIDPATSLSRSSTVNPLIPARSVVSVSFTVTNRVFVPAADLIDGLSHGVRGYVDASVNSITYDDSNSDYTYVGDLLLDVRAVGTDRANSIIDKKTLQTYRDQLAASHAVTGSGN